MKSDFDNTLKQIIVRAMTEAHLNRVEERETVLPHDAARYVSQIKQLIKDEVIGEMEKHQFTPDDYKKYGNVVPLAFIREWRDKLA